MILLSMAATLGQADRVRLSVVGAAIVVAAEILRLVLVGRLRWELGYPEMTVVEGVLFTLVYMTYAGVLVWRGRTLVRRLVAPLLVLPAWLFDSFWLVVGFVQDRSSFDLPSGEWWLWVIRFVLVITTVCLVVAWGVARRRGFLWLIGLLVPVVLMIAWLKWWETLYVRLDGDIFVLDLVAIIPTVLIPLLGCLACWGIEALSRRRA